MCNGSAYYDLRPVKGKADPLEREAGALKGSDRNTYRSPQPSVELSRPGKSVPTQCQVAALLSSDCHRHTIVCLGHTGQDGELKRFGTSGRVVSPDTNKEVV